MPGKKLEICVDSVESALNASEGGADRLELCSALSEGGLSPTPSLLKVIKENVQIPIFCMVRPRGGPMVYSSFEKQVLLMEAEDLKNAGADGLVFGALTADGKVDKELCDCFLKVAAAGLPCTFHRAFDLTVDPLTELDLLINLGFQRILTSGCKSSAVEGAPMIKQLVDRANGRIIIMAGAGVKSSNCLDLISSTGVSELHSSAKMKKTFAYRGSTEARMGDTDDDVVYIASAEEVRRIKERLMQAT